MGLQPINILSLAILLALLVFTFTIVYEGPIKTIFKNENAFVHSTMSFKELVEPVEWPILTICKNPFDRNTEKFYELMKKSKKRSFSNESEFDKLIEESYFTKPADFVNGIGIGKDFHSSFNNNETLLPLPPYVTSSWIDVQYMGYCAHVHFEALRLKMIMEGKIEEKAIDSQFFAIIGLKVYVSSKYKLDKKIFHCTILF